MPATFRSPVAILLLLLISSIPRPASALLPVDASFLRMTTREGLTHDSVSTLLQDRQGFLWVGTAAGLNRFDGHQIRRYRAAEDGLAHDQITRLLEAHDGTLWIATHNGLSRKDPATGRIETPQLVDLPPLLGRFNINALAETPDGQLWIGTGIGLLRLDPQSLRVTHVLRQLRVTQLVVRPDGALWVGCPDGALLLHHPTTGITTAVRSVPPLRQLRALIQTADGALWVAGVQEHLVVGRLAPGGAGWRWFSPQPADTPAQPLALADDREGGVFLGSDDGLWHLSPATGELRRRFSAQPRVEDALPDSFVPALLTDRQGWLWLGTTMGLLRLDLKPPRFPRYRYNSLDEKSPPAGHVWALREDQDGGIWVGTRQGLGRLDRSSQQFRLEPDVSSIRDLYPAPDGQLYVAAHQGLLLLDNTQPGAARRWIRHVQDQLPDERINRVMVDGRFLYLGTSSAGLCRLPIPVPLRGAAAVQCFPCASQDPERLPCAITALQPTPQGLLYVGGRAGLFLFDPRQESVLRSFRYQAADPNSLSNTMVLSLLLGRDGSLWVGTSGGLNQLPGGADGRATTGRFLRFARPLLPEDTINGILEDQAGWLWLTTNDGLLRFGPQNRQVQRFDVLDGLLTSEFNLGAVGMTRKGEMLVGGPAGFHLFSPERVQPEPLPPQAHITAVRVNGQPQALHGELRPRPGLRRLEFEFAVPSFDRSQRVRAAYRLEGLETAWTESAGSGTVTYGALPPGRYRFQVRGRSADGVWEAEGAALTLQVKPSWWRTPVAYVVWTVLLALFLLSLHRLRVSQLQQRSAELELRVAERTETLRVAQQEAVAAGQAKTEFLALMSHEIRTPLNAVLGMTSVLERTALAPRQEELLLLIRSSGELLLSLINDILDFSKIESGKLALHETVFSLRSCVRGSVELLRAMAASKGLDVTLEVAESAPEWVYLDSTRLRQVLINLLGNAIKFTDQGEIRVYVDAQSIPQEDAYLLRVEVKDTGPGIPLERQGSLFQPFTVGDPALSQRVGGTGLGLVICRRLCTLMGGDIQLFSQPGDGATFMFTLRAARAEAPAVELRPQRSSVALGLNVLVCEDHPLNQQATRGMLGILGCTVTVVGDGAAGLQAVQAELFDVVLMDVMMPGISGLEATRLLRQLPSDRVGQPWIIAMSAGARPDERRRCQEAGMDDFLSKPAWLEDLEAALLLVPRALDKPQALSAGSMGTTLVGDSAHKL